MLCSPCINESCNCRDCNGSCDLPMCWYCKIVGNYNLPPEECEGYIQFNPWSNQFYANSTEGIPVHLV